MSDGSTSLDVAPRIAVIIPCFRVGEAVFGVLEGIGPWCDAVYCVDDGCPDGSGAKIRERCADPRVRVITRERNGGVGAATMTGYRAAIDEGAHVLVKVDGDGQMDPRLVPWLVRPILDGRADYVKGNRFFSSRTVAAMPLVRLIGNAGLSFLTKLSTGYWDLFDPTNGFTAIHAAVARELPFDRIHPRYFFESDMLFRLGVIRARVVELPFMARYGNERSNLSVLDSLLRFPWLHLRNLVKRILYGYFLRNFSVASLNLVVGLSLIGFGALFGAIRWTMAMEVGNASTAGTVMLAALPILLGLQLVLSFLQVDIASTPAEVLHGRLAMIQVLGDDGPERPPRA